MKDFEDMTRDERKQFAAACSKCGGWTEYGGMSQYADGPDGCDCLAKNAAKTKAVKAS